MGPTSSSEMVHVAGSDRENAVPVYVAVGEGVAGAADPVGGVGDDVRVAAALGVGLDDAL